MRRRSVIVLVLLVSSIQSYCQKAYISGIASDYKEVVVPVKQVVNPITEQETIIDSLAIDNEGRFNVELDITELTWIVIDLGIYQCTMLTVPGYKYRISLPPRRDLTEEEIRSPFFEPMIIHLRVYEEEKIPGMHLHDPGQNLNNDIFKFDTLLFRINSDQLVARTRNENYPIDSLIESIEFSFINHPSEYFKKYRKYRYGLIQMNSGNKSLKSIYDNYLSVNYPEFHNPAYLDLFNKMYERFFYYFSRTKDGEQLNRIINLDHNLHDLRRVLNKHNSIPNDTIADLVILKEVNESFYRDFYYKEALLMILDSLILNACLPDYQIFAMDVRKKLTTLMIGTRPPDFSLPDLEGKAISLADLEGKYVLLMFCTPDNYSCLKEYPFLKVLHEKHKEYLDIVTVMITEHMEEMEEFMENNQYHWKSLFYENNQELLQLYNIRAFPTCYLIGPDGLLIQSPATIPTEGLEQQLFRIMRSRGDL